VTDPSLSLEALICWLEEQDEALHRALKFAREVKGRYTLMEPTLWKPCLFVNCPDPNGPEHTHP
jgi:hypothetical protein